MTKSDTPAAVPIADIDDERQTKLDDICQQIVSLSDTIADLEREKKDLTSNAESIAKSLHLEKIQGEGWLLYKGKGGRKDIKAELLLSQGVSLKKIDNATVEKTWEFYAVKRVKP
jgi:hypothetical protein